MTLMKNYFLLNWQIPLLLILSIFTIWPILGTGYFSHHDDLQVMRIFEMRKCFADLQIPCRWVPDMGYGNGYPMFNYYGVFPYYLGAILSFVLGFIGAAKALFLISLVLGFISIYLLAKEIFNSKGLAILAAVLFGFAPYRALDVYVRGALDESFALALVPLAFYFSLRLIREKKLSNFLGLTLSLGAFLTTHNIMTLFFSPLLVLWTGYWLIKERSKNLLPLLILAFLLGFGLAAFFLLPAYFEKGLVQTDNLIKLDLNFRAHFVTLEQLLFDHSWGYGASVPGNNDTISFQIGWPHWWLVFLSVIFVGYKIITTRQNFSLFFILFLIFLSSIFMTHNKSAFIWEKIHLLSYAQFPWRFLTVTIFAASLLGVWWISFLPRKLGLTFIFIVTVITIILNFYFFKPEIFYPNLTDQEKLSGKLWDEQQKAAILDYLPQGAIEAQKPAPQSPEVILGAAEIANFINKSNSFSFQAKVNQNATIEIPVYDFSNWTIYLDGAKTPHSNNNHLRRISLSLGPGDYLVLGRLENTPIRKLGNMITLLSLLMLVFITKYGKSRKIFS